MFLLLSIYYRREHLKMDFPEVLTGDYSKLLKWVSRVCLKQDVELGQDLKQLKKIMANDEIGFNFLDKNSEIDKK